MIGIIYNPLSRKGKNRYRVEAIRKILDDRGFEYEYRETECPMDGIRVAREMSEKCDTIVAVGGDGTVYEVLNGAIDKDVTFGILPFGSGNDISRSLHVFEKTDEELADMIMVPKPREIDTGLYDGKSFALFLSFGLVVGVCQKYQAMKGVGRTAYPMAVIKAVMSHKAQHYHVKLPDREFDCKADFIAVQNVPTAGGGLYTNGTGKDDDGHMELVIINHKSFFRLLRNALALFRGKLHLQKNVDVIPVTEGTIVLDEPGIGSLDGELIEYPKEVYFEMGKRARYLS